MSNTKSNIKEKREYLKNISKPLLASKMEGLLTTVNEGLINIYNTEGHNEIKTFKQWKKEGKKIKKGEKALMLWGRPVSTSKKTDNTTPEEEHDEFDYFPICFVFSNKQVE